MSTATYHTADGWKNYPTSFSLTDLDDLEAFLSVGSVPMREAAANPDKVAVRHDLDYSIEHGLRFAEWEHEHGIRSSYYVLHTAWYYEDKPRLYQVMQMMEALGHEVGLHHDVMSEAYALVGDDGPGQVAADLLAKHLAELREQGFEIDTVAAHGGKISGMQLWDFPILPSDFGVEEAYHLHRGTNYISDNRGHWRSPLEHVEGKQAQVLTHPCHWPIP